MSLLLGFQDHLEPSIDGPFDLIGALVEDGGRPSHGVGDIRLGIDGIWLVGSRGERGTYLPQVATETGWSKEKFLSSCASSKAGMPPDAWRDPDRCTVQTYTAEVFSEGGD